MSTIWIDKFSRLKSYSATAKGGKSTVRIEIECDEPGSLGYLLTELGEIQRAQDRTRKAEAKAAAEAKARAKRKALPAPLLRIEDMREER